MAIWAEFQMGQYMDNGREYAPHFTYRLSRT